MFSLTKKRFKNIVNLKNLLIFQIMVFALFTTFFLTQKIEGPDRMDIGVKDFTSGYSVYNDGWNIAADTLKVDEDIDFLKMEGISLPKGNYVMVVGYRCDEPQRMKIYEGEDTLSEIRLKPGWRDTSFEFRVDKDTEDFRAKVKYSGNGLLCISEIGVYKSSVSWKKAGVILLALFLAADLIIIFFDTLRKERMTVAALSGIVLLISLPLFISGMHGGHDIVFHTNRIAGMAEEIKAGNIPVRILSSWFNGYGYPVPIYYGSLFLYVPAVLYAAGFTILTSYKVYLLAINALTVVVAFFSFKVIFKRDIALLCTLAYVTASYRLLNVYVRAAVGEYTAMAFFPLIAASLYLFLTERDRGLKDHLKYGMLLSVGLTGIIESHTLSVEMIAFLMIIFLITHFRKILQIKTIIGLLTAFVETILINAGFIVPFLDYYFNADVNITGNLANGKPKEIQEYGVYLGQLFAFFENPFGYGQETIVERMSLTPGCLLVMTLIFAAVLWLSGEISSRTKSLFIFSLIVLFMSLDLFPWDAIGSWGGLGRSLVQIQFPFRYVGPFSLVSAILLGFCICDQKARSGEKSESIIIYIAVSIALLTTFVFVSQFMDGADPKRKLNDSFYEMFYDGEYLRNGMDIETTLNLDTEPVTTNAEADILTRNSNEILLYCTTGSEEGTITVPMFNYKGYRASGTDGTRFPIFDDKYCRISFMLPPGYSGQVRVFFDEPWYWRFSFVVSIVSVVLMLLFIIRPVLANRSSVKKTLH